MYKQYASIQPILLQSALPSVGKIYATYYISILHIHYIQANSDDILTILHTIKEKNVPYPTGPADRTSRSRSNPLISTYTPLFFFPSMFSADQEKDIKSTRIN